MSDPHQPASPTTAQPTPTAAALSLSAGWSRRDALRMSAIGALAIALPRLAQARPGQGAQPSPTPAADPKVRPVAGPLFTISLAQWSLHRALRAMTLDHLDFPKTAKDDYGILAVEYVNVFFKSAKGEYVGELRKRCDDLGVRSVLIMCDGEGALGDPQDSKRLTAVDNHRKWLDAAKQLGCHSIRVNAQSDGPRDEQEKLAADGLRKLCEAADPLGLNVIVENHGGLSSHGDWLVAVLRRVAHPRVGTLPDFGNFYEYDRYQGVADMMPFAKGVSAKSYDFSPDSAPTGAGDETKIDYRRMLKIVFDAGYHGHIGIEYEGDRLSEPDGIRGTKRLLERLRTEFQAAADSAPRSK